MARPRALKFIRVDVKVSLPKAGGFFTSVPIDVDRASWQFVDTSSLNDQITLDADLWVQNRLKVQLLDKKKTLAAMKKALGR